MHAAAVIHFIECKVQVFGGIGVDVGGGGERKGSESEEKGN